MFEVLNIQLLYFTKICMLALNCLFVIITGEPDKMCICYFKTRWLEVTPGHILGFLYNWLHHLAIITGSGPISSSYRYAPPYQTIATARNCPWTAQKSKKQHPPSRLHRNARRLASFIEKKQAAQETCTQEIRKDTKCETIISKPVELTAADEVESTMLNLTPAQHVQETQDDKDPGLGSSLQQHPSPSPTKSWIPL